MHRVVLHIDQDAFYVAVERRLRPELRGVPLAVVQYDARSLHVADCPSSDARRDDRSDGSLIAVSYEARAAGVRRQMRGAEARTHCPQLALVRVPTAHGKADIRHYREAGEEVLATLAECFGDDCVIEKASVDEAYADVTAAARRALQRRPWEQLVSLAREAGTHVEGLEGGARTRHHGREEARNGYAAPQPAEQVSVHGGADVSAGTHGSSACPLFARARACVSPGDALLVAGAAIAYEARQEVERRLTFTTSCGVAHNKLLAKLASGVHKPNQQTLIPEGGIHRMLEDLPLARLRGLGGGLGEVLIRELGVSTAGQLARVSEARVRAACGSDKTAAWVLACARGEDSEAVKDRGSATQVGYSKTFVGPNTLRSWEPVEHWLAQLAGQLAARLRDELKKGREPRSLNVGWRSPAVTNKGGWCSRALPFPPRKGGSQEFAVVALAEPCAEALRRWASSTLGPARAPLEVTCMSVGASRFESVDTAQPTLMSFAAKMREAPRPAKPASQAHAPRQPRDGQPTATEAPSPGSFDLSAIDMAEQRLLLAQIERERRGPPQQGVTAHGGAGHPVGGKRARASHPPNAGKKQRSVAAFFAKRGVE